MKKFVYLLLVLTLLSCNGRKRTYWFSDDGKIQYETQIKDGIYLDTIEYVTYQPLENLHNQVIKYIDNSDGNHIKIYFYVDTIALHLKSSITQNINGVNFNKIKLNRYYNDTIKWINIFKDDVIIRLTNDNTIHFNFCGASQTSVNGWNHPQSPML